MIKPSLYSIKVLNEAGNLRPLSDYTGKVLLIVNTASACGFTPQLEALEELYQLYKDRGFEVLAFPSNDFGEQEPLKDSEIQEFCQLRYRTTFPIFQKMIVKGPYAHPLYKFLSHKSENGMHSMSPKWNFHKYLINRQGEYVDYFFTFTKPGSNRIKRKIEKLLKE